MIKSYEDLKVWNKAMELVSRVYSVTQKFPREEIYGLTSQLRRAAVSIPSNIAEGHGRHSLKEFQQFLINARGSLFELETQIKIACNLEYLNQEAVCHVLELSTEVGKMINGLRTSLEK